MKRCKARVKEEIITKTKTHRERQVLGTHKDKPVNQVVDHDDDDGNRAQFFFNVIGTSMMEFADLVTPCDSDDGNGTPIWLRQPVAGILMDISGVLKDGDNPIVGSLEAMAKLHSLGIPYRLVTNETQMSKNILFEHLNAIGFKIPTPEHILSPSPVLAKYLVEEALRPKLLVHEDVLEDFNGTDQVCPNCLVVGDAAEKFSYENMNEAFRFLMGASSRRFFTLGRGKFYQLESGLTLDVGAFTSALEFATGMKAELVGKPSASFFKRALKDLQLNEGQVVMIGDDIVGDIKGAQDAGIRGVLVRTGKYRDGDESRHGITPNAVVNNLLDAITQISVNENHTN